MQSYIQRKSSKKNGELGLTTVEYIIILCLIAIFCFGIWQKFGQTVEEKVSGANDVIGELDPQNSNN